MTHSQTLLLEELERRNYSQTTTRSYLRAVEDLSRHFNRPAEELRPEHIREYQAYLFRERHLSANSVNQRVGALRFFFNKALKRNWSFLLPSLILKFLKSPRSELKNAGP